MGEYAGRTGEWVSEVLSAAWLKRGHRQFGSWPGCETRLRQVGGWNDDTCLPKLPRLPLPAEIISHAVWLYFRVPLSLRMVDELLAARGITVSHETVCQWGLNFSQGFANQIRRRLPAAGHKWHLDEVVLTIAGVKHWL